MNWKFSLFCFLVKHHGFVIIKNTFTGALVCLKKDDYKELKNYIRLGTIPKWAATLKGQNGILVKDSVDEVVEFRKLFLKTIEKNQVLTIHFLPTLACQLKCPYCFEKNILDSNKRSVNNAVIDSMFAFLNKYIDYHNIKIVKVIFFGGEPLLRKDLISRILFRFKILSINKGIM